MTDADGRHVRLDDSSDGRWAILHTGDTARRRIQAWTERGRPGRSGSANRHSSVGCGARRRVPWCCAPTDSSTPHANPGSRCPHHRRVSAIDRVTRSDQEYPHEHHQSHRTHRHRRRQADLRRRNRDRPSCCHAARRRTWRVGRVQLLAQHRRAGPAFPRHRARHARLRPLRERRRPRRSVRLPRRHDPRSARRARRRHRTPDRQLLRRCGRAAAGPRHARTGSASWC